MIGYGTEAAVNALEKSTRVLYGFTVSVSVERPDCKSAIRRTNSIEGSERWGCKWRIFDQELSGFCGVSNAHTLTLRLLCRVFPRLIFVSPQASCSCSRHNPSSRRKSNFTNLLAIQCHSAKDNSLFPLCAVYQKPQELGSIDACFLKKQVRV